jgi:hypothetical protein
VFINKPVTVKHGETLLPGTIVGTFGKSGKQKVQLKNDCESTVDLTGCEVELRIKVFSKELSKMRNIK